jgi:hypothetical protein
MFIFYLTTFGGTLILPYARLTGRAGNAHNSFVPGMLLLVGISSNSSS